MKFALRTFCMAILAITTVQTTFAQLSGSITIPGSYPTLAAAISDLNSQGVNGPLTITLSQNETAPVGGYVINTLAGSSAANTVTISSSPGVVVTAPVGTASGVTAATRLDAIFYLNGCDYVTLDGITMTESATNTTVAQMMEYGIACVAPTSTNGVQYCTIKNCNISLTRSYVATAGFQTPIGKNGNIAIYMAQHTISNSTEVVPTTADGAHSYNTIINNTISNVFNGILMIGHASATAYLPTGNKIGDTPGTGNTITDFGSTTATGSGSCHGIRTRSQLDCSINYNTITSLTAPHTGGHVFAIFLNGGSTLSTYTTNGNTISVANATTSTTSSTARIFCIRAETLANWTADANIVENCVFNTALASGMTFNGIDINGSFTNVTLTNNQVRNNTMFSSTTTSAIFRAVGLEAGTGTTAVVTGNQVYGNTIEGTGTRYLVYGQATASTLNMNNNIIRNQTLVRAGSTYMIYALGGSACNTQMNNNKIYQITSNAASTIYSFYTSSAGVAVCNDNRISDVTQTGTGAMYNFYGFPSTSWSVNRDTVTNLTSTGTGTLYGVYCSTTTGTVANCIVSNINGFGTMYGIYNGASTGTTTNNIVQNISSHSNATTQIIYSLYSSNSTIGTITGNRIKNITNKASTTGTLLGMYLLGGNLTASQNLMDSLVMTSGTTNLVHGIWYAATGTSNVLNNVVTNLFTANGTSGSAVNGLYTTHASGTINFYNNTIRLNCTMPNSGASGLYINGAGIVNAVNNIFDMNVTTSNSTKSSAVIRRASATTGTYAATSNNNIYWINDAPNHFYYIEGVASPYTNGYSPNAAPVSGTTDANFNTACSVYKLFLAGRESSTFLEQITFAGNVPTGTTYAEKGATPLAAVTVDFNGTTRSATPDIGAFEFNGTAITGSDQAPPFINYTNLSNSVCTTTVPLTATITDASGVNIAAGSAPRVWYKKSTELDVLPASNTSLDNGWKYVEASNTSSPFIFNIDLLKLTSSVVAGDIIQYFVAAQDNAGNVALNTVGLFGGFCATSMNLPPAAFPTTASPTKKSFTILAAPTTVTAVSNKNNICVSGVATLSLTGSPVTGAEYQWQSSPSASGPFTNIAGATSSTYTVTINNSSQDLNFQCIVLCGGSPLIYSSVASIVYSNPSILTTQGAARCGTGSVDLLATASPNATINWYTAATGGTPVGSGSPFTTPALSAPTTYYVAAAEGGATSIVGRPASPLTNACGTAASTTATDWPIRFNTTAPVTIASVTVIPAASGAFTMTWSTALSSTYLFTYNTTFTTAQVGTPVVLPINLSIPTPGTWQFTNTSGGGYRVGTHTATCYPMNSALGGLSIVGSATSTGSATSLTQYNIFFDFVVQEGCESARLPVVASVAQPPAITVTPDFTMCSNDPAQPLTVSSSNAGYTYEWGPASTLNTTTGTTVLALPQTTTTYSVTASDNSGGPFNLCAAVSSVKVTVNEIPQASNTKALRDTVCFSDNITLSLEHIGTAKGLTYQWQNSFDGITYSDVVGATTNTYNAYVDGTTANYYQCKMFCKGNLVLTSTPKQLIVNAPAIISTAGATRCGSGSVNLSAVTSPGHTARWYESATGGLAVAVGNTFNTPSITATKDYYVAASGGGTVANVGLQAPPSYYNATTGTYGIIFNALTPFTLYSVDLYPVAAANGTPGTVTIALQDANGVTLQSATVNVTGYVAPLTAAAKNTVVLNFLVPAGNNYRLTRISTTGITSLQYDCGIGGNCSTNFYSGNYPTSIPGVVTQLGGHLNSATLYNYYVMYFYNWQISTVCESARQIVTATVTPSPGMTVSPDVTVCSNGQGTPLSASSSDPNYTYSWSPSTGLSSSTGANVSANPPLTTTYTVTGTNAGTGCADISTVKVAVNQVPTMADVTATVDTVCFADNSTLSLINMTPAPSGVDYQWQSSTSATGTFADISGATNATYTAFIDPAADKFYRCNITCLGSPGVISSSKEMFVTQPGVLSTTPGFRCGTGTVTLSATPNNPNETLKWYTVPTNGSAVASGNSFTTPVISATTDYWVASTGGGQGNGFVGKAAPSGTDGYNTGQNIGPIFTALVPFKIKTVDVYPYGSGTGTVTITLKTSAGTTLFTSAPQTVTCGTSPVLNRITVDVPVTAPGVGYQLLASWSGGVTGLYRDYTAVVFPFTFPGVCSITASTSIATYYYYVYNWQISTSCESPRTMVTATVNTPDAISVSPDVTTCSAGPSQTLTATSTNAGYTYEWAPATGLSTTTGSTVVALPPTTTTYNVTATDASTACVTTGTVKVTVNPTPNDPVVVASTNSTPCGAVTLLEGTGSHQPATALMGTGNLLNTTTTWPCPIGNWYKGQRHQFIYTKSELDAIGMNVGSVLNSVSMLINTQNTGTGLTDYTVKVGHTTKSSFTSVVGDWVDPTTLTTVFNTATLPQPATGSTLTFQFNNPFAWNGTDNLVIEFASCNGSASTYTTNPLIEYSALGSNQTLFIYSDGTPGASVADFYTFTAGLSPTASPNRTNLTFSFTKPANYTWTPASFLFTDAACTVPYVAGATAQKVWSKPPVATTYSVSAATPLGCSALQNGSGQAVANARYVDLTGLGTTTANASSSCEEGGWTNYFANGKIFFAINWAPNGTLTPQNNIAKNGAAIKAVLDAAIAQCENADGSKVYAMKRWWNVTTSYFNTPVNVRFYYDPAEITQAMNAAGGAGPTFSWFKNNTGAYNQATMVSGKNGIANGAITNLVGTAGVDQGINYIQFDGITSFSGGTGAAKTLEAGLRVSPKVFLNHVNTTTGLMDDYVKTLVNFPLVDPYTGPGLSVNFTHVNSGPLATVSPAVLATTGPNAIVDWVFLELRSGTAGASTVFQTRAALLQRDGDVVGMDGVSPVSFYGLPANYFLSVRHRNHIGFRTDAKLALSPATTSLDFTNNSVVLNGAFPLNPVTPSISVMNGGDANSDGSIDSIDSIDWETQNGLFDDYILNADYNLDGSVDSIDSIIWEGNNGKYQELD